MSSNIILSTDEIVICPNCTNRFPIEKGITTQIIKKYEEEYKTLLQEDSKEIEKLLSKENEKRIKKVKQDTEEKLKLEFDEERKGLKLDLEDKDSKIKKFREQELKLLKEHKQLEEDKQNFELDKERELKEAKQAIEKKVLETEAQKFEFKEAEYKKKLEEALKANLELTRKLEQGSQQLQGEVFEEELERILRESFVYDDIKEIAKGARGADVLQRVCTQSGQVCGSIVWEAKRTQNWSDKWLQKVKDDCLTENADIPVTVSTNFPKESKEVFLIIDGVWVCRKEVIRPVAETLRLLLIKTQSLLRQNEGQSRKADLIYNYLGSAQFAQNLRSIFEAFAHMKQDLDREKTAMYKSWKKRDSQLERVAISMSSMVGQIQSIAQNSLPELDKIDQLLLPGESETE